MPRNAGDILLEAAQTYQDRNAVYGDNFKTVGKVMADLFPNGLLLKGEDAFTKWHLFELMIVKITRFANTGLTHQDSIRDAGVYAAMVEACLPEPQPNYFADRPVTLHEPNRR